MPLLDWLRGSRAGDQEFSTLPEPPRDMSALIDPRSANGAASAPRNDAITVVDLNSPGIREFMRGEEVSTSGVTVNSSSAMRVAAVNRCVNLRSSLVGEVTLDINQRTDSRQINKLDDHPVAKILRRRPNSWMTPAEFRRFMQRCVLLRGNGYALKVVSRGQLRELLPLHPDRVEVCQEDDLSLEYIYTRKNGQRQTFKQKDIFHVRGPTEDGYTGISVISDAVNTIGVSGAMNKHAGNMFKNGAAVSAVLSHPKSLDDASLDRLRASVDEFTQDGSKAWKAMILEEGMSYQHLGMTNSDAQALELAEATAVDIAMFFGVPPFMLGLTAKSTSWGTGIEQQWLGFVATTLGPDLTAWQGSIDRDLIGLDDPSIYAKFNPASLIKGDIKTRYYAYSVGRQWGWLSVNDIREKEDMNPVEDGDGYLQPLNMTPLGYEPPEDPSAPAKDDNPSENTGSDA